MPGFKDQLSPEQMRDGITFLKALWAPEQRQFQWEDTKIRGGFLIV